MNPLHSEGLPPLELPSIAMEWASEVHEAKEEEERWVLFRKERENKIKAMCDNSVAFAGPHKISWKTDKRGVRPLKIKLDAVKS